MPTLWKKTINEWASPRADTIRGWARAANRPYPSSPPKKGSYLTIRPGICEVEK
jgi:hypothetical protein